MLIGPPLFCLSWFVMLLLPPLLLLLLLLLRAPSSRPPPVSLLALGVFAWPAPFGGEGGATSACVRVTIESDGRKCISRLASFSERSCLIGRLGAARSLWRGSARARVILGLIRPREPQDANRRPPRAFSLRAARMNRAARSTRRGCNLQFVQKKRHNTHLRVATRDFQSHIALKLEAGTETEPSSQDTSSTLSQRGLASLLRRPRARPSHRANVRRVRQQWRRIVCSR